MKSQNFLTGFKFGKKAKKIQKKESIKSFPIFSIFFVTIEFRAY